MTGWIELLLAALAMTNLALLGSSRLRLGIRIVAVQGVALGLLPLVADERIAGVRVALLAAGTIVLKGIVFPRLLSRARRQANVRREKEPLIGFTASMLAGAAAFGFSLWLASRLPLPETGRSELIVPVALFTILCGLLLIVTRRIALNHVLGYLTFENGVYAFGIALALREPLVVELGVLLDVFVAVFVMGIAIFHISREFDSIDTDELQSLRDWDR